MPCFERQFRQVGLVNWLQSTDHTSADSYQLVRLAIKKDTGGTVLVSMGGLGGGMSNGPEEKNIIGFSSAKIGSGIFKVTPEPPA